MNNFQGNYIISKLEDNNRIIDSKKIETLYFYHREKASPKEQKVNNQSIEGQKEDNIMDASILQEQPIEDNITEGNAETLHEQHNDGEDKESKEDEDIQNSDVKPVEITPITEDA